MSRGLRIARRVGLVAGLALFALICILAIGFALLLSGGVRDRILASALERADRALPGRLVVSGARWSAPGTIDFEGLVWTSGPDTLAALDAVALELGLRDVLRRELRLARVEASCRQADLPAIRAALDRPPGRAASEPAAPPPFFAEGALPGLPSMSLGAMRLNGGRLRLTEAVELATFRVEARAELRRGREARVELLRLQLKPTGGAWSVARAAFVAGFDPPSLSGRVEGRLGPDLPLLLEVQPGEDGAAILRLQGSGGRWEEPLALDLDLTLAPPGESPRQLRFGGAFALPGSATLAGVPGLESALAGVPALGGVAGSLGGALALGSGARSNLDLELSPSDWLEAGLVGASWGDDGLALDTLRLALPDLVLGGGGAIGPDDISLRLSARAAGLGWWDILLPAATPPDSLSVALDCTLAGPRAAPGLTASATAGARWGGFRLDGLSLLASMADVTAGRGSLELEASAADLVLRAEAELESLEPPIVALSPLRLQAAGEPARAPTGRRSGSIRKDAAGGWRVENLQLLGAAGEWTLGGERGATGAASLRFECAWPLPPPLLAALLPEARRAPLAAGWRPGGYSAGGEAAMGADGSISGRGRFLLPGPAAFAPLPPSLTLAEPEVLAGTFAVSAVGANAPIDVELDLGASAWIDSGRVVARAAAGVLSLAEASLRIAGLQLGADGEWRDGGGEIRASIALADTSALRAAWSAPAAPSEASLDLALRSAATGAERLALVASGSLSGPGYSVPEFAGDLSWGSAGGRGSFAVPAGADLGATRLETLSLSYRSEGQAALPGAVVLALAGPELAVAAGTRLDREEGWSFRTDSLRLRYRGNTLAAEAPFGIRYDSSEMSLEVDSLALSGTAGEVSAHGLLHPTAADFRALAAVTLPQSPPLGVLPQGLWPERLDLEFSARGRRELRLHARAAGIRPFDDAAYDLDLDVAGVDSLRMELALGAGADTLLAAGLVLPSPRALFPMDSLLVGERLRFSARAAGLPLPLAALGARMPASFARLDGRVGLGGSAAAPVGSADLRLSFPELPKLREHGLTLGLVIAPPGVEAAAGEDGPEDPNDAAIGTAAPSATGRPGLAATLLLDRGGRELLRADLSHDAWLRLDPPALQHSPEDSLNLLLASTGLALGEFDALFPTDVGVRGTCSLELTAAGAVGDPSLGGWLQAEGLGISWADGSQLRGKGSLRLDGSLRRPVLGGRLEVASGVLRVPEAPQSLHPVAGESMLWRAQAADPGETRTASAANPPRARSGLEELTASVEVAIPAGLWLRGKGLEVELSGDLALSFRAGQPTLVGQLAAVQGFLIFLGRGFSVDRGSVTFYGEDELDPALDLQLSTRLSDTRIKVAIAGTLKAPELTLSSEPSLSEGDIMGLLFFGRPLDELNGDQIDLLQQRAADIATTFSSARLEMIIASRLGVDQVSLREGQGGDSALVMGKYLSRRVLLTYEQTLDSLSDFYVNLEYFLSRDVKLETLFGQRGHSGLEFIWSKEY